MVLSIKKKFFISILTIAVTGAIATKFVSAYTNSKSISVSLPHNYDNVTAAEATKTTHADYAHIKITEFKSTKGVNAWLRSQKSDGTWDPLNSMVVSIKDSQKKQLYYKNPDTGYTIPFLPGTKVQLRMENQENTWMFKGSVKGTVWFN